MRTPVTTTTGPTGPVAAPVRAGSRKAAFTLLALAPLVAELAFSTPVRYAFLVLLWVPIYGGGVLLIREAVARTGRGWPSILLLGLAYEVVEDGIGLQALSSPHLYHAAQWGARLFGLNLPYWEVNAFYHVVFSATVPIVLTNLLFPAHRGVPYLKRTGLVVTGIVALLGVGLLRIVVPPSQDPGYSAPLWVTLGCVAVVAILAVVALVVVPRRGATAPSDARTPTPVTLILFGALGVVVELGLLYPLGLFGGRQPGFTHGWWVLVPMAVGAVLAVVGYRLVRRWSASARWTGRHALALAGGAMVAHSLFGVLAARTTVDRVGLVVIAALTAGLCLLGAHRMARRAERVPAA